MNLETDLPPVFGKEISDRPDFLSQLIFWRLNCEKEILDMVSNGKLLMSRNIFLVMVDQMEHCLLQIGIEM